jgi:hypothetical protein
MAFTPAEEAAIRKELDQIGVRRTLDRYFHCVDAGDWDLLATCFTDDAYFEFNLSATEKKVLQGGKVITDYFHDRNRLFKTKTHYVGHAEIVITGDTAKVDLYALSNIVINDRISIRGLRYADELVRGADGNWRFRKRVHRALWSHYATFVEPEVPPS